ncbi:DUF2911 domain-containing protein [Fulvivirga sp. 29W222]|uniref:DUF2911 domain-containing protein n=1 Tax=Fulvivirga marina TaxID=2494733 RepID=A0A937FVA9_9BACT|nr:DUF2911 domain-containing protein [Fulvivirga marina]MBL6445197.1 DUF2911 domain-containing protein [Fulvivirga marina]
MLFKKGVIRLSVTVVAVVAVACNSGETSHQSNMEDSVSTAAGQVDEKPAIASPRRLVEGKIGSVKVSVDYGSPGVKERKIWGGLEAYGKVWRAGANETTALEFNEDIVIGGVVVPAGKYGFYLIPNKNKDWVAIVNTDWSREEHGAWGAYNYNKEHDVVRVNVQPQWTEEVQERLQYDVTESSIDMSWEKVRISVPLVPAKK